MAYGLQVKNASGRIIFDTREAFPTLRISSQGTATNGQGIANGLVFAQPSGGGNFVSREFSYATGVAKAVWPTLVTYPGRTFKGAKWVKLAPVTAANAPSAGTYGLSVFGPGNVPIFYSGTLAESFEIAVVGRSRSDQDIVYTIADGSSISDYYCLISNSYLLYFTLDLGLGEYGGGSTAVDVSLLEYVYGDNTITIRNRSWLATEQFGQEFMIVRRRG